MRVYVVAKGSEALRFEELSGVYGPDEASKPKLVMLAKLRCLQLDLLQLRALTPDLIVRCFAPCWWHCRRRSSLIGSISDSCPWATARAHGRGARVQRTPRQRALLHYQSNHMCTLHEYLLFFPGRKREFAATQPQPVT